MTLANEILDSPWVAVDTETEEGKPPCKAGLRGVSLAWGEPTKPEGRYWSFEEDASAWKTFHKTILGPLFENTEVWLPFWNASFDLQVFGARKIVPAGTVIDGMMLSYLIDETNRHALKACAKRSLGVKTALTYKETQREVDAVWKEGQARIKELKEAAWKLYKEHRLRSEDEEVRVGKKAAIEKRAAMTLPPKMRKKDVLEAADRYIRPRLEVVYAERRKDLFEEYATNDALWTMRLTHLYYKEVRKRKLDDLFWDLEMPVVKVLASMETRGARMNTEILRKLQRAYQKEIDKATAAIAEECGEDFNPGSHVQLKKLFWKDMGIEPPPWAWSKANIKKGNTGVEYASTDESVLKWLAEEHEVKIATALLRLRKLNKMHGTYVEPLLERAIIDPDNRIHCSFNPVGTPNDRLSSSDPNLQNIPRPGTTEAILKNAPSLRSAFIPAEGYTFLNPDFSQIELRILAHITQDPVLLAAYRHWKCYTCGAEGETDTVMHYCPECWADVVEAKGSEEISSGFVLGKDIHWETAVATGLVDLYGPVEGRYKAKNVNFGLIYGMFPKLLAKMIKVPLEEAQLIHRRFFLKYERVRAFHLWVEQKLIERGYFTLLNGRRRHFLRERQLYNAGQIPDWKWSGVVREAVNSIIQGGAAILMKYAMRDINAEIETGEYDDTGIILQVHDELLIETPDDFVKKTAKMVQDKMEHVKQLRVPIIAEVPTMKAWHEAA